MAELRAELAQLTGFPVSRQSFACNSMLLWLGPHPQSVDAVGLLIHPVWQLVLPGRDIVSSDEFPMPEPEPTAAEDDSQNRLFWDRASRLGGLRLERASVLEPGMRLLLSFEGGATLEQWPCAPDSNGDGDENDGMEDWNLRIYARDARYTVRSDAIVRGSVEHG